jgi:hypothetical protein
MNKRLGATAIVIAAVAAAAGLFASPSISAQNHPASEWCTIPIGCTVALTGAGPSPSTLRMVAAGFMSFDNTDSVTHKVVFAKGLCSLTLIPGEQGGPGSGSFGCGSDNFPYYVGRYPYTLDGRLSGTIVTTPWPSSLTLTARTHTVPRGARLSLHVRVLSPYAGGPDPKEKDFRLPVIVLGRHTTKQPFEPVATVLVPGWTATVSQGEIEYAWKLKVRPAVTTTYIAKSTGRLRGGQIWAKARSRPFTVRVRP